MGNNVSGILAMVFMARMESQIVDNLSIGLYKRYVDDVIILTTNREEADNIANTMNGLNGCIKFETEHPNPSNAISLLDFYPSIDGDGNSNFCFYRKAVKKKHVPACHISPAATNQESRYNE